MPVTLLELSSGQVTMRKVDGSTLFSSASRMPHVLQELSVSGVTLDWPQAPGETQTFLPLAGQWRHFVPSHTRTLQVSLGSYTGAVAPQFFWARATLTRTTAGFARSLALQPRVEQGVVLPWLGSIYLENGGVDSSAAGTEMMRVMNLAVSGGAIVVELRQGSSGFSFDFSTFQTTQSVWSLSATILAGVFDA